MANLKRNNDGLQEEQSLDLTATIRKLSLPETASTSQKHERPLLSAVLVCRDATSRKWGPRWLEQAGLSTTLVTDAAVALRTARELRPHVIIVEAGLRTADGKPLFEALNELFDRSLPILVLCSSSKDVQRALDAEVTDVVRKPIEWSVVSRRAMIVAETCHSTGQLEEAQTSLKRALELAEHARRHLRSRDSTEPVTGLPNHLKFVATLERSMAMSTRANTSLVVLVIGLSRFRLVIEALGRDKANEILTQVGQRLRYCLLDRDATRTDTNTFRTAVVANLGPVRFGLMLSNMDCDDGLNRFQQRLSEILRRPFEVAGQTVYLSACMGASVYPRDGDSAEALVQRADRAMLESKRRGGGFRVFCKESDAQAAAKLELEHLLHESFERGELYLAYQPLIDVSSGRVVGAEALLRWQHPDNGAISPAQFVPVAEESGLMIRIGEFVIEQACRQLRSWIDAGLAPLRMAINVSRCQLMDGKFVETVERVLREFDVPPALLDLELSERGVLANDREIVAQLRELKALGVRISIDDFGTGDSAIAYLKDLPIDVLKIDRSYINGVANDGKDSAITSAMVALGQRLDLTVIAEGVESQDQLSVLRQWGCDQFQGFHFSPAVPAIDFAQLVDEANEQTDEE